MSKSSALAVQEVESAAVSTPAPAATPVDLVKGPRCAVHLWPLVEGVCGICAAREARGLEVAPPCPPHTTWSREFKAWLFNEFMLDKSQGGTDEERLQRSWEGMLHTVAGKHHRRPNWTTPAVQLYDICTAIWRRLTSPPAPGASGQE